MRCNVKLNYTLIGHNLKHSISPEIHARLFSLAGIDASYDITDIAEDNFSTEYSDLKKLSGYNVTIPHKVRIIPFLDKIDSTASRYGAVNTVLNSAGISTGYNSDCFGFTQSLEAEGLSLSGRVLLLGFGGVGKVMAMESVLKGANLTIAVLSEMLEQAYADEKAIKTHVPDAQINIIDITKISGKFDILVNSTPVGMFPHGDASPVPDDVIAGCSSVFDAIYNPVETQLMKKARALGKKAIGGISMLVWQAVAAHKIWDGSTYSLADVQKLICDMEEKVARDFK